MVRDASSSVQPDQPGTVARRRRRLVQELALRCAVAVLILVFDAVFAVSRRSSGNALIRWTAMTALALNAVYYAAARTGWRVRVQAYVRMLGDVALITTGLYGAGGLAASPFIGVYAIVPLYVGLVFSSVACLVAAGAATAAYLAVAVAQHARWIPSHHAEPADAWVIAAFNLLVVALVGVLTALLAEAYRRSRLQLAAAHRELEHALEASHRLNAEIQRAAQLRALGEVVAGVAHEMANVLTVATGHVELLRRATAGSPPEIRRPLDRLASSVESAVRIVTSTLNTARRSASRPALVAMPDIVDRVLDLKAYDFRRAGVRARVEFPPAFPPVRAVPFQVQQVLLNLATNAQQAMQEAPPPRVLTITGRVDGRDVLVTVADSGPGIPRELLPRVFEPFVTTKDGGTGLGLAISAGIVRDLHGDLVAENRPGGGAVFHLRLPIADDTGRAGDLAETAVAAAVHRG